MSEPILDLVARQSRLCCGPPPPQKIQVCFVINVLNENDLKWSTTLCKELDEGIDINKELNILAIDQSRLKQLFDQHRLRKAEIQARGKEIVDEQRRVQGTRSTLMDRRTEIELLLVDAEDTIENGPKQKTPQQSQQYFC